MQGQVIGESVHSCYTAACADREKELCLPSLLTGYRHLKYAIPIHVSERCITQGGHAEYFALIKNFPDPDLEVGWSHLSVLHKGLLVPGWIKGSRQYDKTTLCVPYSTGKGSVPQRACGVVPINQSLSLPPTEGLEKLCNLKHMPCSFQAHQLIKWHCWTQLRDFHLYFLH